MKAHDFRRNCVSVAGRQQQAVTDRTVRAESIDVHDEA
jgi:hypothetical protein